MSALGDHCADSQPVSHLSNIYPILETLEKKILASPDTKWGFVVYRCTYGDDIVWERFMDRLNIQVRQNIEAEGASNMVPRIDWDVQKNRVFENFSTSLIKK